jgi:hypothetical protein
MKNIMFVFVMLISGVSFGKTMVKIVGHNPDSNFYYTAGGNYFVISHDFEDVAYGVRHNYLKLRVVDENFKSIVQGLRLMVGDESNSQSDDNAERIFKEYKRKLEFIFDAASKECPVEIDLDNDIQTILQTPRPQCLIPREL